MINHAFWLLLSTRIYITAGLVKRKGRMWLPDELEKSLAVERSFSKQLQARNSENHMSETTGQWKLSARGDDEGNTTSYGYFLCWSRRGHLDNVYKILPDCILISCLGLPECLAMKLYLISVNLEGVWWCLSSALQDKISPWLLKITFY